MSTHDNWDAVRVLDDAENWAERNEVLFKEDHTEHTQFAKEILHELVNNLPISAKQECESADTFTEDLFDMDYLESLKMQDNPDSGALNRDSIYIKFDPLVSEISLTGSDAGTIVPDKAPDKRDLDTTHSLKGVEQCHIKCYSEDSKFSPIAEVILANNESHATDFSSTLLHASDKDFSPVPVTSSLVKFLKYSDEDLMKLVQLAKRRANQRERHKIETQLHEVKEMIIGTRGQMQLRYVNVYTMDSSRSAHLLHMHRKREEKRKTKERVIIYDQRIRERSTHFLELQKQKTDFEFYEALLLQDQTQLENVFDELHTCHVKQKELNKGIVKEIEDVATYLTEVREWHQQASELYNTLVSKREATKKGLQQAYQAIQNEYETRLAVERTKTKKLQLKIKNLQEDLILVKQDKQQLTQICDDLMKQLEFNT